MDQLIKMISEKVGVDEATAERVVGFIQEHIHELPGLLAQGGASGLADQAKGLLGGFLGGDKPGF
jgi:hypothetical protein